ncbi:O-antigen ligase family protein [Marinobacter salinisoli]|uniref:O-antigen ligase family protein n=1 Tax=Marinobacter salinisoli TaxID=2769486 RepID=A0ABX7MRP8_9GAMM|nr:O-antigen ligase family protein [Marinobacter salinisoli]QSP94959.1 O-antigen ligase family protein [Marinobacter salinisoli]
MQINYWIYPASFGILATSVVVLVLFGGFFSSDFDLYAIQRFLLVGILAGLTLVLLPRLICNFQSLNGYRNALGFCCLLLAAMSISGTSGGALHGWVEPVMFGGFFILPILLAAWLGGAGMTNVQSLAESFLYPLVVGCLLYGYVALIIYAGKMQEGEFRVIDYLPWGFNNIRYWSHIASWALPVLPLAVFVGPLKRSGLWRLCVLIAGGLWWWVLILSSARGSTVGLVASVFFSVVLMGRQTFPWLKELLRHFSLGILFWLTLSLGLPAILAGDAGTLSLEIDTGDSGRIPMFAEAFAMSMVHAPFGMGAQSWLTHELLTDSYQNASKFSHPHNMYLFWAAEYGWTFVFGVLGLVAVAFGKLLKKRAFVQSGDSQEYALCLIAFTASVVAALVHASVSAVFLAPASMLVGLFIITIFWMLLGHHETRNQTAKGSTTHATSALAVFVISLSLSGLWLYEVWQYHQAMLEDKESFEDDRWAPRFWLHGNFPRAQ